VERVSQFVSYVQERKSKQTGRAYKRGAERFERFCQEKGIGETLDGQHVGFLDAYVSWMIQQELSASTVRLMLAGTNAYLEWRKRQGETIPHFLSPDLPRIIKKEPYALNAKELVRFWRACASHPDPVRTVLTLLPLCGLRSEEIVTIRMEGDVEVKGEWIVFHVTGKGGKKRSVPLLPQGNDTLGQYMHGWRVHTRKDNPFLFPGHAKDGHYHTRSMRRHMASIREEMDLSENLTPHVLRKTYLTFLDNAGISPFAIAKLAGHSSPKVTHESYIHQTTEGLISKLGGVTLPQPTDEPE
jgi:site-specific recombinase XerD